MEDTCAFGFYFMFFFLRDIVLVAKIYFFMCRIRKAFTIHADGSSTRYTNRPLLDAAVYKSLVLIGFRQNINCTWLDQLP